VAVKDGPSSGPPRQRRAASLTAGREHDGGLDRVGGLTPPDHVP
jgi:hypothetical protein